MSEFKWESTDMSETTSTITNSDSSITNINPWGEPERVDVIEHSDSIEMIFKERSIMWCGNYPSERVFKVIFSCMDGKWHKSERIYGEIEPATEESYSF